MLHNTVSNYEICEGATKDKCCCMVFKIKMYQILSKCTRYGQPNTKTCQQIVNMGNANNVIFRETNL